MCFKHSWAAFVIEGSGTAAWVRLCLEFCLVVFRLVFGVFRLCSVVFSLCLFVGRPLSEVPEFWRAAPEAAVLWGEEEFGYPPLNDCDKERILGLNAAELYGVDVEAARGEIAADQLSKFRAEEGSADSSRRHYVYGPESP